MRKTFVVSVLLLAVSASPAEEKSADAEKASETPNKASADAQAIKKTQDEVPKKAIGEAEARTVISRFVNAQLKGKTFVDAGNQTHPYPKIEPGHWRVVELKDGRWTAKLDPPAGVWATASVDENGNSPKLEGYGFAPQ